jgi:hypothetical protein
LPGLEKGSPKPFGSFSDAEGYDAHEAPACVVPRIVGETP